VSPLGSSLSLGRQGHASTSGQLESGNVVLSSAVHNPIPTPTGTDATLRTSASMRLI